MFASRISLSLLAQQCRSLSSMFNSGVPLLKALNVLATKTANSQSRNAMQDVVRRIKKGEDLTTAFRAQGNYFPPLFCDILSVGERSGNIPEVLTSLAEHYENLLRLRRTFIAATAWPLIQLFASIFIVAFLIWILGQLGDTDILGWGLMGASGAIRWLGLCFGTLGSIGLLYFVMTRGLGQQRLIHGIALSIPVVGHCMRSFAIARFSWAYWLTQNSGMPIEESLQSSFGATGNAVFAAAGRIVTERVMVGDDLGDALAATDLFPHEYLLTVQTAEASGTVPEALHRLSPQFEDAARRSLGVLVFFASGAVWLMVAGLIIFIIFSIILSYVGIINDLSKGI